MAVSLYTADIQNEWDDFIARSKNGTFLLLRGYMDYHTGRFDDFSLVVRDEKESIIAVLPANRTGDRVASHGGLTYGGFISDDRMKAVTMLNVFEQSINFLQQRGITTLEYKRIPHIYHRMAAEEDLYALFLSGARITRCDALAVVYRDFPVPMQERRKRGVKKALRQGLAVRPTSELQQFWEILSDNLRRRYNRLPVHTVEEISLLHDRFPQSIKLFGCFESNSMVAGVLIYETDQVAHAQYTAANDCARENGGLDLLFHILLTEIYAQKPCFDFGISTENNGRYLNRGLMEQKEGFGARLVAHDHYEIDLSNWKPEALQAEDNDIAD